MSNQIINELKLLAAFKKCSLKSNKASEKVLQLAFTLPKPLFNSSDKTEAINLFKRSLPYIRGSINRLNIRLEPDLVNFAKRCCSGFQFIVEELNLESNETESIFESAKEYIKNCEESEIEPEYPALSQPKLTKEELSKIPQSHWWWFIESKEN